MKRRSYYPLIAVFAAVLVCGLIFLCVAADLTVNTNSFTYKDYFDVSAVGEDGHGSVSVSGGTFTVNATYTNGTCSSSDNTTTLTLTAKADLSTVTIKATSNSGQGFSFKIDNDSIGSGVETVRSLNKNQKIVLSIKSKDSTPGKATLVISNLVVAEKTPDTVFAVPSNGSYTITYAGESLPYGTYTKSSNNNYVLKATPENGYSFLGWYNDDNVELSTNANYSYQGLENHTIRAIFYKSGNAVYYVKGAFGTFYDCFDLGINATGNGKILVVHRNGIVVGSEGQSVFTIPNGRTLLVPFDADATVYTDEPYVVYGSHTTPSPYRTLIIPENTTINVANGGMISVPSKLSAAGTGSGSWNGTPTGAGGRIEMNSGSSIILNSGAGLYCYGYISGEGSVVAESGSTVYEAMQFRCWRGGTATSGMRNGVFPMNQYYIQNIEAQLKLYSGANEYVYTSANTGNGAHPASAQLIGTNSGMFRLSSGYIEKRYDASTDELKIDTYGNMSISPLSINVFVDIDTSDYNDLPITNNLSISVHTGKLSVPSIQNLGFLAGTKLTIDEGAEMDIASKVYVYDQDDWGKDYFAAPSCYIVPVGYSTVNGTTAKRSSSVKPVDALFDINGTLTVTGKLFTTEGGANIISSGGTGKVVLSSVPTDTTTTQQATQDGTSITKVTINCTAAKLHNGANHPTEGDYAVDEYTLTQGAAAGTTYYYCSVCDAWYDEQHEHPHVHTWNEPVIEWAADYSSVTATFVCADDETHVETVTDDTIIRELRDPQEGTNVYTYAYMAEFEGPDGNTYKPEHTETGLFAGWYKDAEFTEWYTEAPEDYQEAYAKLVDPNILRFAFQLKKSATVNDESTVIRTLSSVDTLNYKSVGFIVSYTDAAGNKKSHTFETTTVYSKITGTSDIGPFEYEPSLFSPDSTRFFAFNLTVPCDLFEIEIEYTPFWVTYDGTTVKGKTPAPFALSKYLKSSTNG